MSHKSYKDILVMGFALFAMFFGAGNLIFPPYLGFHSGENWLPAFLCFIVTAVGLSILALLVIAKNPDGARGVMKVLGPTASTILLVATALCIGPFLAIPRTAATTFELAVAPVFPGVSSWVVSIIFFTISTLLCIKPTKVMDIVGSILSPLLLVALAMLIVKGVITPLGDIAGGGALDVVMKDGILSGYQTMDMLGATLFSVAVIGNFAARGYTETKSRFRAISASGMIAALGLFLVYGGLAYIGATTSSIYQNGLSQAELLIAINHDLLGKSGVILLGVIVASACLTTAIGITTSCATYFVDLTRGKLRYEALVILISGFSCVVSNFGISTIISFSAPILEMIYPVLIVIMALSMFDHKITNVNIYRGAALATFLVSIVIVAESVLHIKLGSALLPLSSYGFGWLLPATIGGVVGSMFGQKKRLVSKSKAHC